MNLHKLIQNVLKLKTKTDNNCWSFFQKRLKEIEAELIMGKQSQM